MKKAIFIFNGVYLNIAILLTVFVFWATNDCGINIEPAPGSCAADPDASTMFALRFVAIGLVMMLLCSAALIKAYKRGFKTKWLVWIDLLVLLGPLFLALIAFGL